MQTGKKAVESIKETASNVAASAKSGMDKTKATVQEKVDKIRAHDDFEKDLATQRKDERIAGAELYKQEVQSHNLAEKEARTTGNTGFTSSGGVLGTGTGTGTGTHSYSTTGVTGAGTGAHQMSAMPGHGTGQPTGGHVVEGTAVGSHPIGRGTGTNTTRTTTAENRHVGGETGTNTGLTGSGYRT